jgi:hypothetical protein
MKNNIMIALLFFSAFAAGLVAFLWMKYRTPSIEKIGVTKLLKREFWVAFWVTVGLYIGSFIGHTFLKTNMDAAEWNAMIIPYALYFFLEAYIAMIWMSVVSLKIPAQLWRMKLASWSGLFVIFLIFNITGLFIIRPLAFADIFRLETVNHLVMVIPNALIGAFVIFMDPLSYFEGLFMRHGNNHFELVYEFPKWSVYFLFLGVSFWGIEKLKVD